jgi:propionyl-CoA synthetase
MSSVGQYAREYERSLLDPAAFWREAAHAVAWFKAPATVFEAVSADGRCRWFSDGVLNTCFNVLDRHVESGHGDNLALIYDSPVTETQESYTYSELTEQVAKFAGVLISLGVKRGDRVLLYLPMIPQAVIAMLACARIGAVHAVVFGGFGAAELASRIDDAKPKIIVTASCGIEPKGVIEYKPLLEEALRMSAHSPHRCVVYQRPQFVSQLGINEVDWADAVGNPAIPAARCEPVPSTDPLYILYTSGTTGHPKGIVRDNGGHAVALAWSMENLFDIHRGDVFFAASDIGWVVGHSYIVYGPLLVGATTILYEGKPVGTPDSTSFWRVISDYHVQGMFTAPTAIRSIRNDDPAGERVRAHDLSSLRAVFAAGERLDPDTYKWMRETLRVPIVDNWWQTETGWPIATNPIGIEEFDTKAGSATVPSPGFNVKILDPNGVPLPVDEEGAVCIELPLPPGALSTVWEDDARFVRSYLSRYPGYYLTGDRGYVDADGYLFVLGRTDDVIKVAGHRLSSGQIEAALAEHDEVSECAVIGVFDPVKGEIPRAVVVPASDRRASDVVLESELKRLVRDRIGAIASIARVDFVPALPKTRSGKIVRRTLRQIAEGREPDVPSTIENPSAIAVIAQTVHPL